MNIFLKHPVHGTKIATLEMEAAYDEEHGWVRYNPNDPEPETADEIEIDHAPVNANELQAKRRGRPPKIAA